jgi:hypothetical protein
VLPHKYRSYKGVEPGRDGWPGPYAKGESGLELYNLKEDVSENNNVVDLYPEIVEELTKIAGEARLTLGDDLLGLEGTEVRPCGRVGGVDSIFNMAKNKTIKLENAPAKKYDGLGGSSLIDGVLGSYDFLDGKWLGYRENDMDITIDLGESKSITQISARFLINQTSWIFLPGEVEISVSSDNKKFNTIFRNFYENDKQDLRVDVREIVLKHKIEARFIRVKATGIGKLPVWHPGRGEVGWLFIDEVIIN